MYRGHSHDLKNIKNYMPMPESYKAPTLSRLFIYFDLSTPSMRKVDDEGEKKGGGVKKIMT